MFLRLENFRVNALKMPFASDYVDENLHSVLAEYLHIPLSALHTTYRIWNKSIDSRRGDPELIYTLGVEIDDVYAGSVNDYGALLSEKEYFAA